MAINRQALRRDVQGLRAIAVIVVVLNHMFGWPSGGFVGVDMFFVISGYLITDLMLRERDRSGRISWVGFYRRRIRRIMPVALVVLAWTVATSHYLYPAIRAHLIWGDALWAAVFLSNWHFADVKTDYFNNEALVSPLQHFWSLAVEEQFYVVWPVVVIAVSALCSKRLRYRRVLTAVIGLAVVCSFAYAMHASQYQATSAYFSTPARVWELGVGALIAVSAGRLGGLQRWARDALAWLGMAGIAVSMVLITSTSTFPAPWAALPVLSTAAVIVAGTARPARGMVLLTNPVSQYVGNVSYSLYLWHFPVVVMLRDFSPEGGAWRDTLTLAAIASLTVLSFHFIEDPIRRSTWLERRDPRKRRVRYVDALDSAVPRRAGFIVIAMAILCSAAFAENITSRTVPRGAAPTALDIARSSGATSFEERLRSQIDAALNATTFPALSPSVDQLDANKAPQWKDCGTTGEWNATKCTYGSRHSGRKVAVIGDSIALSWLPGLNKALISDGYRVHSFVAGKCPAADVRIGGSANQSACAKHRAWAIDSIVRLKPDLIVVSDASALMTNLSDGAKGESAIREWRKGATKTFAQLTLVGRTVVISSPPGSHNLINCHTVRADPRNCNGSAKDSTVQQLATAEKDAARETGASYADVTSLFCSSNGICPSFVGTTPVYVDGEHLTRQYSEYLAPGLLSALKISKKPSSEG